MNQRILVKLDELEQLYAELTSTLTKTKDEYLESNVVRRAVERLVQVCIECIIDICSILAKDLKTGVPQNENDIFDKLEGIVFTASMVERLRGMKRFRNRIVHRYGELDDDLVYDIVIDSLSDFQQFRKQLKDFLKTQ